MNDYAKISLFVDKARKEGMVTLGRAEMEWLGALAEVALAARGRIFLDTEGMPDAARMANASTPEPRRRRRAAELRP
jgi:hypothetical protein